MKRRGSKFRRSSITKRSRLLWLWGGLALVLTLILGTMVFLGGMRQGGEGGIPTSRDAEITSVLSRDATAEMVKFHFEEVRQSAGIDFHHFPARRSSLLPEDMGSGLAWGDYDNDGDPDLFLVNFQGSILETTQDTRRWGITHSTVMMAKAALPK